MSCDLPPDFYSETYPVARKEHRCEECGGTIKVGEIYARCSGKWDGEFQSYVQHKACRDFVASINIDYFGECLLPFGGLREFLANAESEYDVEPPDAIRFRQQWSEIEARVNPAAPTKRVRAPKRGRAHA